MSLFSKQHYIWLASFFRDELSSVSEIEADTIADTIDNIADCLQEENPNFDKSRFLHAIYCGMNHKPGEICPHATPNQ